MYLKSLTLKGFKSFASSTTLKLEPGICAVVGPNGSGKSNVVDALAWVMGEQGAKTLRGGSMDDVIFAGAGSRKPLGRAEVTLTIDNSDGALPIEYSEVSITRRVFRDGGGEYEINGTRARLMDIQELLSDSGIGREMHVIVGQGRLASILESKPEDRRAYIEEAAGVLKHRRRKDKAQRKLASMQANVDRLRDLATELERQLKPLAKQAEAAQRAATVQSDLRDARLNLAAHSLATARGELMDLAKEVHEARAKEETLTDNRHEWQGHVDELERRVGELVPRSEAAQHLWFRLSSLSERVTATGRIAADRATSGDDAEDYHGPDPDDLDARARQAAEREEATVAALEEAAETLETIRECVEEKEDKAHQAEKEHLAALRAVADRREGVARLEAAEESARQRLETAHDDLRRATDAVDAIVPELAQATNDVDSAQAALHAHDAQASSVQNRVSEAEHDVAAAESRLRDLRDTDRTYERSISALQSRIDTLQTTVRPTDGAAWLRKNTSLDWGAFADVVTVDRGWETALSAVLGDAAEAITLHGGSSEGMGALESLVSADAGHAWLVEESHKKTWRLTADLPGGSTWFLDKITVDDAFAHALTGLLVDVVAVPSVAVGRALVRDDARLRAVTSSGIVIGSGWMRGGSGGATSVDVKSSIEQAREELAEYTAKSTDLAGAIDGAETTVHDRRDALGAARAAQSEFTVMTSNLRERVVTAEAAMHRLKNELQQAQGHRAHAEARIDNIHAECADLADRRLRMDAESVGENIESDELSTAARDQAHEELTQIRAMETEARLALRSAEERAAAIKGQADRLRRQAEHERDHRRRHDEAQRARHHARQRAAHIAAWCDDLVKRVEVAVQTAANERDALHARVSEATSQRSRARDAVSEITGQRERALQITHDMDVKREAAAVRVEQAERHIREQLGLNPDDVLSSQDLTHFDRAAEEKRLSSAERALKQLGKVNPLALEEYKALEERYSFLSTQLMDVEKARQDLQGVIKDVDATILQLFTDAWLDVQVEFPRVFHTLFPGGEGRLSLTDPDDMLGTGIEVHARPPGKRVTRLSLLSGGEKSLTALALLVAIFRARPSPFYVMDEVEAALDDVNLRRLIALFEQLREDSQLIVITHQKPTMDTANVLYGVTMRGDGVTRVISQRMSPQSRPVGDDVSASSSESL